MGRRRKILTQRNIKQIEKKYGKQAGYIIAAVYGVALSLLCFTFCVIFSIAQIFNTARIIAGVVGGILLLAALFSYIYGLQQHKHDLIESANEKRFYEEKAAREYAEKERIHAEEERKRNELLLKADMQSVDKMSGKEFEEYVCALYNKLGYEATQTKLSGDFGADIIAKRNSVPHIIQTKRSASKISVSAVQEIVGAKSYYRAFSCIVVTNNYFTSPAIKLAMANNVELVDRDKLAKIIISAQSLSQPPEIVDTSTDSNKEVHEDEFEDNKNHVACTVVSKSLSDENYSVNDTTYTTFLYSHYNHIYPMIMSGNVDEAYQKVINLLALDYKNKSAVDVHYFLIRLMEAFYKQRKQYEQCINYTIALCKKDIDLLPALFELKGVSNPLITRLCVIYEKQGNIKEAIRLCDLAEKYGFMDNQLTPFSFRKIKLQNKLRRQEAIE